jgi:hypothetical protein
MNRPTVVTVFGILNLTVALLGLCGAAIASPILALKAGTEPVDPIYAPYVQHPVYLEFEKAAVVVRGLVYVLLAASGVGLLLMKGWGRRAAVFYAATAIVLGAVSLLLEYSIHLPAVLEHTRTMAEGPVKTGMIIGAYAFVAGGAVCGIAYPITVLVFVTRRKFVALFEPGSPDGPPPAN